MRARSTWLRAVMGTAMAAAATLVMSACASPSYKYVANDDRDVVMRVPASWNQVSTKAVLTAGGQDTSTDYGWLVFYDGSARPSTAHVQSAYVSQPVMIARSVDVAAEYRSSLTDDGLRDLLEPVSASARASDAVSRASQGLPARVFTSLSDTEIKTKTERGVHVVFSYASSTGTEYYDQIAVTDPKRTRVHVVLVHCSAQCYTQEKTQIDDAVDSFTVKKS